MNHYATCILDLAGSSTNHLDTRSLCGQNICSTPSAGLPCSTMPFAALVGSTHCWRVFRFSFVSSVIVTRIDDWLFLGQKDRICPIGILPWSSACVECHTHCCRSPWQSQMFASQYRHGQEWWCQISVEPGSAPHCRGHGSTWPAEGCSSGGCCSQGRPSRQSSCGHSGATGSNPPRGDQKRTFSREIREWKSFPGGKDAGKKGVLWSFDVWASFNMFQSTVQGWHNHVNMMQDHAGFCHSHKWMQFLMHPKVFLTLVTFRGPKVLYEMPAPPDVSNSRCVYYV